MHEERCQPSFPSYLILDPVTTGGLPTTDHCDFWNEIGYELGHPVSRVLVDVETWLAKLRKTCR